MRIAQNSLAALSSNSLLLVAPNSSHNIMFDEPERAIEAVRMVVEAVRRNRRVEDIAAPRQRCSCFADGRSRGQRFF